MPKKRPHGKRPIHRRPEQRRHLHAVPESASAPEQELLDGVRDALRDPSPAALLHVVSTMLEVSDPRSAEPWFAAQEEVLPREDLVRSFVEVPYAETTALLTVMSQLLPDGDPALTDILEELPRRRHPLPQWLRDLREGRVEVQVLRMTETLGDGENCLLGLRFPSGEELTTVVFIDHNLGSAVKDAFFLPVPMDEIAGRIRAGEFEGPGPDHIEEWDPAAARATVSAAIEQGRRTVGMPESEGWPALRPAVEWLLRQLPEGGEAPVQEIWSESEIEALKEEFLASPEGARVDDADTEFALSLILSFGSGYNTGGPLRWSPVVAEIFLLDWMPRKVLASYAEVEMMPTLLADFVTFVHRREGVDPELTGEVLLVIGSMVADYGEAMRAVDPEGDSWDLLDYEQYRRAGLAEAVGGADALDALSVDPLPDEDMVWDGIPEDIRARVGEYLELLDAVAEERLDVEYRTAMRRLLARAAAHDSSIFRRKASVPRGAAAIAWAVCRANGLPGSQRRAIPATEVAGWFGTNGSVSERAHAFLRAIGAPWTDYSGTVRLGSADLLVSARRAAIIDERDRIG